MDDPGESSDGRSIFTDESEAIEIAWFNFFAGGYRFERRREQLSPEQLTLVEAIEKVPSTEECWSDAAEVRVSVTAGGTERTYSGNQYTGTCGRDVELVDFEAVSAVLDTVNCLPAKSYGSEAAETAPSIAPDDGCWHGLFSASGDTPAWWFRIEISTAGTYRISLDGCGDRALLLDLFAGDATTPLASASGESACPVLTHPLAEAGSYVLRVDMLSGTYAGDFYLAVESTSGQ